MFLNSIQDRFWKQPDWFIFENAGEYMSAVVEEMLGDKGVKNVPIVPHNQEENGIDERYNGTIMNVVRAEIATSGMG